MSETERQPTARRSGRIVAGAAAIAAVLAIAVGAAALRHVAVRGEADPAGVRSRSGIPWSQVGDGWTLLQESSLPQINNDAVTPPDQLLLIDPHGVKYRTVSLPGYSWGLADWGPRSQQALFVEQWGNLSQPRPTDVLQVDLRTGAEQRFTAPGGFTARYGDPDGRSILLDYGSKLADYTVTGRPTWTLTVPTSPFIGSSFASSPDAIITNGATDLNVYDPTSGRLISDLPAPDGFGPCALPQWQGDGKLTALCASPGARSFRDYRPFVFSVAGTPAAGRVDPEYPPGWTTVTGFRDGTVAMAGQQLPYLAGARLACVDSSGHTTPLAIPEQFTDGWLILGSTADSLLMAHLPRLGPQVNDRLVSWNPFTGRTVDLFELPSQFFRGAVSR